MSTATDLNSSPYFDDFSETKNYHRILFRPEQAVQARELTQLQTILQNQIERFGDAIFTTGTIIKGCAFNFDNSYHYVKIRDIRVDLENTVVDDLVGLVVKDNVTALTAIVVAAENGYETQNPNTKTIFVKYLNTGTGQKKTFAADDTLSFYNESNVEQTALAVKVLPSTLDAQATNPIGVGYSFSLGGGIVYQNGFFIRVEDGLSVVVSKYSSSPNNLVVGFTVDESIVTEYVDTSIYDNSSGFSNENAPGAHRLKLVPNLKVYATDSVPESNFLVLAEWQNGEVVRENRNTVYSTLGQEFARRTAEESGDYVVTPFVITTSAIAGNTTHLNLDTTQGLAYVNGYRVQKLNNLSEPLRKGTDTKVLANQKLVANYGNYVFVKELFGYFEPNKVSTISLRDTAGQRLTLGAISPVSAPGAEIGTARIVSLIQYHNGLGDPTHDATYKMYLTDIKMNPGKNFQNVKAAYISTGTCDLILESSKAVLKESNFSTLIFPFGQGSVKTLRQGANNNTSYTFRTINTSAKIQTTGTTGAITLSGTQQFPYGIGSFTDAQKEKLIVISTTAANVSLTKAGTVSTANANSAFVTGAGTAFLSEYQVGDWIYIAGGHTAPREIIGISNNTLMQIQPNSNHFVTTVAHAKHYPANIHIPFSHRQSTITSSNSTTLSLSLRAANGQIETLSSNVDVAIIYDVNDIQAVQRSKVVQKDVYVKIDCSNNVANTVGPWSLGLPDVFNIKKVYVSSTYTESAAFDQTDQFLLDDGMRDGMYGVASIRRIPGTTLALANTDKMIVVCDVFKTTGSSGFFSIDSYPIDDANTANTTAITTQQIPYYFSDSTGGKYNLRDCVDMRPMCSNNAVYSANVGSASINPANTNIISSTTENFVASPDQTFGTSLEYYQSRIDKLILNTSGEFEIFEGAPSDTPRPPLDVNGAMTLALVFVKPYPSLSQGEAATYNREAMQVGLRDQQVARYTMKDLRNVAQRVDNLEYYASLSLLEKKTQELSVKDASGLDRFKNGIFVDGFDDTNIANLGDFEFTAILDTKNSVVRPAVEPQTIELKFATAVNTHSSSQILSLDYIDKSLVDQAKASRTRTLGGPSWEETAPTPEIWPPYDPVYDENIAPVRQYTGPYYSTHWNAEGYVDYYTNSDNTQKYTVDEIAKRTGFNSTVEFLINEGFYYPRPDLHRDYPPVDALPFST